MTCANSLVGCEKTLLSNLFWKERDRWSQMWQVSSEKTLALITSGSASIWARRALGGPASVFVGPTASHTSLLIPGIYNCLLSPLDWKRWAQKGDRSVHSLRISPLLWQELIYVWSTTRKFTRDNSHTLYYTIRRKSPPIIHSIKDDTLAQKSQSIVDFEASSLRNTNHYTLWFTYIYAYLVSILVLINNIVNLPSLT